MSPPPGSAADSPSRSVVIGAAATGRHLLDIEGYSHIKQRLPTSCGVELGPFTMAGHSWRLKYYPNSDTAEFADFISVSIGIPPQPGLINLRATAEEVGVRVTLSLLDQSGEPALSQTKSKALRDFVYPCCVAFHDFINRAWLEASEHLRDDRLTISCDVAVPLEIRKEERGPKEPPRAPAAPSVAVPPSDLHRHLGDLRAAQEGTDVAFQVAGETFRAHRCVLAARCTVFRAELLGPMKGSADAAGVVRVDDMEPKVFAALLAFVYTDALPDMAQQEEAAMAQHLLVAADRYNLERLKLICEDKLCRHIDTASAATILALAEQHSCRGLKRACLHFLGSPSTLSDVAATDGFEHLAASCPSVMKELIHGITARGPTELREARREQERRNGNGKDIFATTLPADFLSPGEPTNYWSQVLVLVILCVAVSFYVRTFTIYSTQ